MEVGQGVRGGGDDVGLYTLLRCGRSVGFSKELDPLEWRFGRAGGRSGLCLVSSACD